MSTSNTRFVVVGFGWVGQANALALAKLGEKVAYFDPGTPERHYHAHESLYEKVERISDVRANDGADTWYIVCVGDVVSEDGVQDISNIKKALASLSGVEGSVILRSTVLPQSLRDLTFSYYIPEFLHEKKAVEECIEPYLLVIGARKDAKNLPPIFTRWEAQARKTFKGTPEEASYIKYLSNLWNSVRIAFVNEFGDAIGRPSDKEGLASIERVIDFLFDGRSYMRYGRAFGGHCLPKDTRAFVRAHTKDGIQPSLLAGVYEANDTHKALESQFPLMPEWYSEWPDRHISGKRALVELWYSIGKYARRPGLLFTRLRGK